MFIIDSYIQYNIQGACLKTHKDSKGGFFLSSFQSFFDIYLPFTHEAASGKGQATKP